MRNFDFAMPTQILFGRDTEAQVGRQVRDRGGHTVLLHYGGGSVQRSGLYDRVTASLEAAGLQVVPLGGVQPNPRLTLVREGIDLCRRRGVDFLLAVGGGSVIDSAKAIAVGAPDKGNVWDFYIGLRQPTARLPLGVVLTIPAAGSEASNSSVITNEQGWLKRGLGSEVIRPDFAILNPVLTYTLPAYQTACGAADIMAHVMERYFTNEPHVDLTDRLCEAVLTSMIHNVPLALAHPEDYDARAEIMWAATLAHNDLLSCGRVGDWASHQIEHELSALYDVAHGAGLAVVFPAWMRYVYRHNVALFAKFASRVFGVPYDFDNPERTALAGIDALRSFFAAIGLPVTLSELGVGDDRLREMAQKVKKGPDGYTGQFVKLTSQDVYQIYCSVK
ncbi:MAG: iron-containing alcohol dehydrogenase [Christensenellales bacterium]|jgi:alcohol dehydrogenase YqhD (iron-dependent ADH family)